MNQHLVSVFQNLDPSVIITIARQLFDAPAGQLSSSPKFDVLDVTHNDRRTVGIIRVSGMFQREAGISAEPWSVIAKLVDFTADSGAHAYWTDPRIEALVYEQGCFADDALPFRPARSYGVTRKEDGTAILWVEDLSGAKSPPFEEAELEEMAFHLGQWNGRHSVHPRPLPFAIPTDSCRARWRGAGFEKRLVELQALEPSEYVGFGYGDVPLKMAAEFYQLISLLHEKIAVSPHSLAFGDCQVGNLFFASDETVAVDWASLTSDPTGVDGGCLIGSALTWGRNGALVAQNERQLFESYAAGMRSEGWRGSLEDLRAAYLTHFCFYHFYVALGPVVMATPGQFFKREFLEKRYQAGWEELPRINRDVILQIPVLVDQLRAVLERP